MVSNSKKEVVKKADAIVEEAIKPVEVPKEEVRQEIRIKETVARFALYLSWK